MIRCQVTGKLIEKKFTLKPVKDNDGISRMAKVVDLTTLPYTIITETRPTKYHYFRSEDGTKQITLEEGRRISTNPRVKDEDLFTTEGYEIVQTKSVCFEVYSKHVANGGLVC